MEKPKDNEKLFEPMRELIKQHNQLLKKEQKAAIALLKRFGIKRLAFWSHSFFPRVRMDLSFPEISFPNNTLPDTAIPDTTSPDDELEVITFGDPDPKGWEAVLEASMEFWKRREEYEKELEEKEKGLPQKVKYNEADEKLLGALRPPFKIDIKSEDYRNGKKYINIAIGVAISDGRLFVMEMNSYFNEVLLSPVKPGQIEIYKAMMQSIQFNLENNIPPSKWGLAHHRFVDPYTYKLLVPLRESKFVIASELKD